MDYGLIDRFLNQKIDVFREKSRFAMKRSGRKIYRILVIAFAVLSLFLSIAWGAERGQISSAETHTGFLQASDDYEDSWKFYGDTQGIK